MPSVSYGIISCGSHRARRGNFQHQHTTLLSLTSTTRFDMFECLDIHIQVERDRRRKEASDAVRRQIEEALKEKEDLVKVGQLAFEVAWRRFAIRDSPFVHLVQPCELFQISFVYMCLVWLSSVCVCVQFGCLLHVFIWILPQTISITFYRKY